MFEPVTRAGAERLALWMAEPLEAQERAERCTRISEPLRIRKVLSCLWPDPAELLQSLRNRRVLTQEFEYSVVQVPEAQPGCLPPFIERRRRRRRRRVRVDPRVRVTAEFPARPDSRISGQVHDVSTAGLSFYSSSNLEGVGPGLSLNLRVGASGGEQHFVTATVRHVSPSVAEGLSVVGVEFERAPHSFLHELRGVLHPRTFVGAAEPRALWNIYERSGYFQLSGKDRGDFSRLFDAFSSAQAKLAAAPSVGGHVANAGHDVTMHQLQQWPGAWLLFHVSWAKTMQSALPSLVSLYEVYRHAYEHALEHGARWLVTYVQKVARWSRHIHVDIPREFVPAGEASVTEFSAFEVTVNAVREPRDVMVREPEPAELAEIAGSLERQLPPPHIEALGLRDLTASIDADGLWHAAKLERKRGFMVAVEDERVVAFSILDACEQGLHLFRLTDVSRIFSLAEPRHPVAEEALLYAASRWFANLGRERFVHFARDEDEAKRLRARADIVSLGDAWMTVLDAERGPDLLERIREFVVRPHILVDSLQECGDDSGR